MERVFISYRRTDAESDAARIADRLRNEFGDDEVFFDTNTIEAGARWRERIDVALATAKLVIVVIGRNWLDARDDKGALRLGAAGDTVTHEVSQALARNVPIIPVRLHGAPLPKADQLPHLLEALIEYNDCEVRSGQAFEGDVQALVATVRNTLLGRKPGRARGRRLALLGTALALTTGVVVGGGFWYGHQPSSPSPQLDPPRALVLAVKLADQADGGQVELPMKLWHRAPSHDATPNVSLLEQPRALGGGALEYRSPLPLMPQPAQQYQGVMHRIVPTGTNRPLQTEVCFVAQPAPARNEGLVRLDCVEGKRCMVSPQDVGWARPCDVQTGTAAASRWSLLPAAMAAPAPERAWAVPSLQTLRDAGGAGAHAYSEVHLQSDPIGGAAGANRVIWSVRINGNPLLVDGLPADASSSPFDAARGLDLRFGLENLDASGQHGGFENLEISLRFMDGSRVVLDDHVKLRYVALRPLPISVVKAKGGWQVRWTAKYRSGSLDDKYQVFLESSPAPDGLRLSQQRFSDAHLAVDMGGRKLTLVAVLRPPWEENPNHGLNAGFELPNGQIKFSFDDTSSRAMCQALLRIAASKSNLVRADVYRRTLDGTKKVDRCDGLSVG